MYVGQRWKHSLSLKGLFYKDFGILLVKVVAKSYNVKLNTLNGQSIGKQIIIIKRQAKLERSAGLFQFDIITSSFVNS